MNGMIFSRRALRWLAGLALAAVVATGLAGCAYPFPNACEGHGGIRVLISGIYYCHDGSDIGAGWLLFHPHDPRAQQ